MAVRMTRAGVTVTVGIIILTSLLIGGLLWVKHAGDAARRDQAISIAQQNLEKDSNKGVVLNDGSSSKDDSQSTQQQKSQQQTSSQSTPNGSSGTASSASELPQTGPSTDLTFIVIGVLVFVGASYVQSRRAVRGIL